MEEKKMTTNVAELQKENEDLQKKVEELTSRLEVEETLKQAYKKSADEYREYWMKNVGKIKKMKEDIEDVQKLTKKLLERW